MATVTDRGDRKLPPEIAHLFQDDRGVLSPGMPTMGPPLDHLQTGELKLNICSRPKVRKGRELVRVRVIGDRSFGWTEAAQLWGAQVEVVVHRQYDNHILSETFHQPKSCDVTTAVLSFDDKIPWDGVLLATVGTQLDADDVDRLFTLWQPLIAIVAFPLSLSRAQRAKFKPTQTDQYQIRDYTMRHAHFGGVTQTIWRFLYFSRMETEIPKEAIMTVRTYGRSLQTSLDDTLGASPVNVKLEPTLHNEGASQGTIVVGSVTLKEHKYKGGNVVRQVYDSGGLAPDIGCLPPIERFIWVRASSVRSPGSKIIRAVQYSELLGMWDYEGKLESRHWPWELRREVLNQRLKSPPAKMLRSLTFKACELLLPPVNLLLRNHNNNQLG